jgi:hypothetical protein
MSLHREEGISLEMRDLNVPASLGVCGHKTGHIGTSCDRGSVWVYLDDFWSF